jgi:type VI protein secretion system component VasF
MPTWMIVITVIVLLLPVVLMLGFNGRNEADSRGRRISRRWRARA